MVNIGRWSPYEGGQLDRLHCTTRRARDDNIILRMRFPYRITKATDTHSGYVIFGISMTTMAT